MEPLHLLLESCGDDYLDKIGNKYFKLKMRGMKPRALPTITKGAISALHRIIGRNQTGDVSPEGVGCVTRCFFEFSTNEKNKDSWQVFSDDIVVLLSDGLQILINVSTQSNDKTIEKYLERLLQLTDVLSEKGPPLSTKLFRRLARPLSALSLKESMPQDLREMILDRLVTVLRSAEKTSVYQTLSQMKPYLRGLAKLAFSCYIEAQIDIFQILTSSVRTLKEAEEAVGTWFSMHPKLQRTLLESFNKPFSEVSGQFVSDMYEIKESLVTQADRPQTLAPMSRPRTSSTQHINANILDKNAEKPNGDRLLQKPEPRTRCDSSSKTTPERVHTGIIKGDAGSSFSDTLKQYSSMQHATSSHGNHQQRSLKELFRKHNSSSLHSTKKERSMSLKKRQSESNKHDLVSGQGRNQRISDFMCPNSLLVEKNKGFTINQHLQPTLALQYEKQQYNQQKEAKRQEMNNQTMDSEQGNQLENSKERKVQGQDDEVMEQEEGKCVSCKGNSFLSACEHFVPGYDGSFRTFFLSPSAGHVEEEDEMAKVRRWLATSEPEVMVLETPLLNTVDKPASSCNSEERENKKLLPQRNKEVIPVFNNSRPREDQMSTYSGKPVNDKTVLSGGTPKGDDGTKVYENLFSESNCYHPPHEENNNIPRAENFMKGMAHLHKSYQGTSFEGLSQSTRTIDRHKMECTSAGKVTRFPGKEEPRKQREVISSQASEKPRKEKEAKQFQTNKEPGKPKEEKSFQAHESRKQTETRQLGANEGPREGRGAKSRKLREKELTCTQVKSKEGTASHGQGKEQAIVMNSDAQKKKYGKKLVFTSRGVHDEPSLISVDFSRPPPRFVLQEHLITKAVSGLPLDGTKQWEIKLKELDRKKESEEEKAPVKKGDIYDLSASSGDDIPPKKKSKRGNKKTDTTHRLRRMNPSIAHASNLRGPITDSDILFDRLRNSSASSCHQKSTVKYKKGPNHSSSRNWIGPDFSPKGITKDSLRKKLKRPNYVEVSSTDGSLAGSVIDHLSVYVNRELEGNVHPIHGQENACGTLNSGLTFKTPKSVRNQILSTKPSVTSTANNTKMNMGLHEKKKQFIKPDESQNFSVEKMKGSLPEKVWESSSVTKGDKNHKDPVNDCVKITELPKIDCSHDKSCIKKLEVVHTKTSGKFTPGNYKNGSTELFSMDGTRRSKVTSFQNVTPNDVIYKENLEKELTYVQSRANTIIQKNAKWDVKTIQPETTKFKENCDSGTKTSMYEDNAKKVAKPSHFRAMEMEQCVKHEQGIVLSKVQKGKHDKPSGSKETDSGVDVGSMYSDIFRNRSEHVHTEKSPPQAPFPTPQEAQNYGGLYVLKNIIGRARKENENLNTGQAVLGHKLDLIKSSIDYIATLAGECSLANKAQQDITLRQKSLLDAAEDVFGPQNDKTFTPLLPMGSPRD